MSPAPEFPFGKVFQTNFQDSKTETERYQQPSLGDFQRMLETNSTDGTTTLPGHWTCPTWIHIYTHRRSASKPLPLLGMKDIHMQHPALNQAKQNKAGYSLLKIAHQWINPKLSKIIGKIISLTSLPAAGRNEQFLSVFLH